MASDNETASLIASVLSTLYNFFNGLGRLCANRNMNQEVFDPNAQDYVVESGRPRSIDLRSHKVRFRNVSVIGELE